MSMEEIALQHILLQLWSVGYIFVDAIAIASQTLISELVSKKKNTKNPFYKRTCVGNTAISFFLAIITVLFLDNFVEMFGDDKFDLYINLKLTVLVALSHL